MPTNVPQYIQKKHCVFFNLSFFSRLFIFFFRILILFSES